MNVRKSLCFRMELSVYRLSILKPEYKVAQQQTPR